MGIINIKSPNHNNGKLVIELKHCCIFSIYLKYDLHLYSLNYSIFIKCYFLVMKYRQILHALFYYDKYFLFSYICHSVRHFQFSFFL